jgi:hypothetical protein
VVAQLGSGRTTGSRGRTLLLAALRWSRIASMVSPRFVVSSTSLLPPAPTGASVSLLSVTSGGTSLLVAADCTSMLPPSLDAVLVSAVESGAFCSSVVSSLAWLVVGACVCSTIRRVVVGSRRLSFVVGHVAVLAVRVAFVVPGFGTDACVAVTVAQFRCVHAAVR